MSWYLFDADGYLGDFASINGLQQLNEYAENVAGLRSFLDNGWAMQADLKNALENAPKPSNVAVDATLVNLKNLVENADEIVIISDGFEPDTEVEKGLKADAGALLWHLDLSAWNDNFEDEFTAEFEEIIQKNGEQTLKRLPVAGLTFRQEYPQVAAYLKDYKIHLSEKLWPDFNNETASQLKYTLSEGFMAGESMPKLSKRVAEVFDIAKGYRTTRIARTEVIQASNYGAEAGYIQSGVVQYKEWLTAKDERLCPFCNSMNGKRIGLAETYLAKGEDMVILDPKDESGRTIQAAMTNTHDDIKAPPLHPNCRCTLVPVVKALEPVSVAPDKDTLSLVGEVPPQSIPEALRALIDDAAKECREKVYFNDRYGNKLRSSEILVNNVLPKFTARLKSILGGVDKTLSVGSSETTFTSFAASGHTADDLYKMLQISSKGMVYGAHCGPTTAIKSTSTLAATAIANGKKMMENMLDTLGKFTCDEVKMKLNMLKTQLRIHPEFIRAYHQVKGDIHLGWDYSATNPGQTQMRTLFHEFGHHVEDVTNSAKDMDSWRFKRGVESESDIKYKTLYPGTQEKAIVDKFWDAYIGKVYDGGSGSPTEVFSMGLQCFTTPRALQSLMETDFEHFALIYGKLIGAFI